jgi:Carboxypeptidase regulatory-like domain/TonB dependent receptor-like, beta-barrel
MQSRASIVLGQFLLLGAIAAAQDPRGTILGRVTDSTGAVMPGVEVRATNTATNVTASGVTNDGGSYNIPFLLPGTYNIRAELSGFKKFAQDNVQVRVSETVELNFRMEIGELTETVTATAESPVLDTAGSSLGQVVDQRRVLELPLFAGNPMELTLLTPGVANATDMRLRKAAFNNAPSQIATDGNGQYNNEFQIDGVSNTFAAGNGTARVAFSPPATAISEFKMQTTPYDASVGHTIGAVTNVSTAGGTNTLHGEAHFWERNSAFDAPNFFNNKNNTEPPVYQDHRYGASAGGPVWIPGLYEGKNRTFWYYAWEANKWGVPSTSTSTVPTAAQRGGDFSELLRLGNQYQIYDPLTTRAEAGGRFSRQPFPGNIIPQNRLDPVGQKLVNFFPLPNQPGTVDGRNNFFFTYKALEDYYVHLVRVDHAFSDKHRLFARVHYDFWEEDKNDIFGNRVNSLILNRINRGFAFDDVYVLNSKMVLNIRYGLTSQDFPERRASQGFDLASLGFSPSLVSLVDKSLATIPRTAAGGYTRFANWESGDGTNTSLTHSLTGNVTRLEGSHNLKFGVDARVYRAFGNRFQLSTSPDLEYNSNYTRGPLDNSTTAPIGQELAAMLLGVPAGSMARSASFAMQDTFYGLYLHDDWKVNSRLTLNLGLRWELETPITERFDRLVGGFAYGQPNPIEAEAQANYARNPIPEIDPSAFRVLGGLMFLNEGGLGRSPFHGEKNNFQPRIGFAYQLTRGTVLRGGYGIFHDTIGTNSNNALQSGFSQTTPIQASLDNGLTYVANNVDPFPAGLRDPLGPAGGLRTNLGQTLTFYDTNLLQPYAQRWSLGIQQMLPSQFLTEATYVGNRGTRLGATRNINATPAQYLSTRPTRDQATIDYLSATFVNPFAGIDPIYPARTSRESLLRPYPHFPAVNVEEPTGYSWYHSLQARLERRFAQGFTFQLGYTWSKLMEAVEFLNASDPTPSEVVGSFDRTHRLAMSGIWEIPVGRGRRFGGQLPTLVNGIVGGWQLNGVVTRQSGAPLGFGNAIFTGDLKDIVLPKSERDVDRWFNVDAGFNKNTPQQLSSNIRTMPLRFGGIRSDDQSRWDFSIIKNFPFGEQVKMQLRAEVFNAWNQTNFGNPNTTPTNSAFGRITGTSGDARTWQFALKLVF